MSASTPVHVRLCVHDCTCAFALSERLCLQVRLCACLSYLPCQIEGFSSTTMASPRQQNPGVFIKALFHSLPFSHLALSPPHSGKGERVLRRNRELGGNRARRQDTQNKGAVTPNCRQLRQPPMARTEAWREGMGGQTGPDQ